MNWSAYEVFSVISGVVFLIAVVVPGVSAKQRLGSFVIGVGFVAYGIFVATRTSGTWVFPIWIFVIPFAGAIFGIVAVVRRVKGDQGGEQELTPWTPGPSQATTLLSHGLPSEYMAPVALRHAAPAAFCPSCGTPFEEDAGFCGICGAVRN